MFINFMDHECKLSTKALIEAEQILKENPINTLGDFANGELPKLSSLLTILWCSMKQWNHGIKFDDMYSLFDRYLEQGGSVTSLFEFVIELFNESGVLGKPDTEELDKSEDSGKN